MISKKLLSEVFETKAFINDVLDDKTIQVHYFIDGVPIYNNINIHELAHKCKEWAFEQEDLSINTGRTFRGYYCSINRETPNGYKQTDFISDTEPNAIFEACQWILKNNKATS